MAGKVIAVGLVAVLIALFCTNAATQSDKCNPSFIRLLPCVPYVTGKAPKPTEPCCTNLAGVVKTQPLCLCDLINGGAEKFGIHINKTLALALPGLCKVKTPPVSQCKATPPSAPITPSKLPVLSNPSGTTTSTPSTQSNGVASGQSSNGSTNKYSRR